MRNEVDGQLQLQWKLPYLAIPEQLLKSEDGDERIETEYPHTSNIYQLRQFTQDYGYTHPHLVLKLSIHLSNCSLTTLPYLRSYSPFQYPLSPAMAAQYQSGQLCGPMDCSPLGSSVHGIFPARILE